MSQWAEHSLQTFCSCMDGKIRIVFKKERQNGNKICGEVTLSHQQGKTRTPNKKKKKSTPCFPWVQTKMREISPFSCKLICCITDTSVYINLYRQLPTAEALNNAFMKIFTGVNTCLRLPATTFTEILFDILLLLSTVHGRFRHCDGQHRENCPLRFRKFSIWRKRARKLTF